MKKRIAIALIGLLLAPALAVAQPKGGVELRSLAEVELVQKSETGVVVTKRVAADQANVAPGDTVIYTISYKNTGEQPAEHVVISNPIPEHMRYLDKSAEGAGTRIEFSVDNGKSFGDLAKLTVAGSNGMERPATGADVTTIRWTMVQPLAKGAQGAVSFRATVK